MAFIQYRHTIGGKGVAQGLPVRRGSHLYDVEPDIRYPNVLSLGTSHSHQNQYSTGGYYRTPHLPVTFIVPPYVDNHKAGGNLTRYQYYVIKRGQPLMAAGKREATVGTFESNGTVTERTYADPEKLATNGKIIAFSRGGYILSATTPGTETIDDETVVTSGVSESDVVSAAEYDGLDASTQADYEADNNLYAPDIFFSLDEESQKGGRAVYSGLEDTNDEIVTGGVNQYARIDSAIFGGTDMIEYVSVDADNFFFGGASESQGFIFPSSGGAERTFFFNEVDADAKVTLPTDGSGTAPRLVKPIGNVSDVTAGNAANWKDAAVHVPALGAVGVAHTDLEQTTSHQYHGFATGVDYHQPVNTGTLTIPFVDTAKLKSVIEAQSDLVAGTDFNFTDESDERSGMKVGLYGLRDLEQSSGDVDAASAISLVNEYSLLTDADAGYANLYYNFAAPFLVADRMPSKHDKIKSDLFANYTLEEAGYLTSSADLEAAGATNPFSVQFTPSTSGDVNTALATPNVNGNVDMSSRELAQHVAGTVMNVWDMPRYNSLADHRVNPLFQTRQADGERNYLNEGYRRLGESADTAGMKQILADFALMLLGGSSYDYFQTLLPKWGNGIGTDVAFIIEELVVKGAVGMVEIDVNYLS